MPDSAISLHGNWDFVWGRNLDSDRIASGNQDWDQVVLPGIPPGRESDKYLLLRTTLPRSLARLRDPALFFQIALEDFEVFLDGVKIYEFGDVRDKKHRIPSYVFPHAIRLPENSSGKEIRIYMHSTYYQFIGVDRNIFIANMGDIKEGILLSDYPRYLIGFLCLIIALGAILIYLFVNQNKLFIYYSFLVFLNAGVILTANYVSMYFFQNKSVPPTIYNMSLYFIPYAIYLFMEELYQSEYKKQFRFAKYFYLGSSTAYLVFIFLGITTFINMETVFDLILIPGMFYLVWAVVKKSWSGDTESRILVAGLGILALLTLHDIANDLGLFQSRVTLYWYGVFIFLLFQGSTLIHRLQSLQKNYELKENELSLAKRIQNSILPQVPERIGAWELASIYEPMKEVGGDFFDLATDDENEQVAIVILDVSGHGVGAALIASMAKIAFSHCRNFLAQPNEIMKEMNQSLTDKMNGNFATAFCLSFQKNRNIVEFTSAGHPSGLLVSHTNNEVTEFRTKCKPLGFQAKQQFPKSYLYLNEGDIICIYTDGVTELLDPNQDEYGESRLKEILLEKSLLPLVEIRQAILNDFRTWTKDPSIEKQDDLTLILMRYNG